MPTTVLTNGTTIARQAPVETDFTAYRYGTITGRVLDRATGKPLAGIAVGEIDATGHGGSYTQTVTDSAGRYSFPTESRGQVRVGAGMFTDAQFSAYSSRVAVVDVSCAAFEGKTVNAPEMLAERLPVLRFLDNRGKPLTKLHVTLQPEDASRVSVAELQAEPNGGDSLLSGSRGLQLQETGPEGYLLLKRLKAASFSAVSADGRLLCQGTFYQAPGGALEVTVGGVRSIFADGVATIPLQANAGASAEGAAQ